MEKEIATSRVNKQPVTPAATNNEKSKGGYTTLSVPQISLPKSGGGIKSIDDKFAVNAANGTAGYSFPFPFSASRNGFVPAMSLSYNSGSGNSVFGLGWEAPPPAITRRTDKQLPRYNDEEDVFIFSGAEDLAPVYKKDAAGNWVKEVQTINGATIARYRPRVEGGHARMEKITEANGNVYWKVTTGDNSVLVFGKSRSAQLYNPADPAMIFKWLLEFSYDDKGNCFQFAYKQEDKTNIRPQIQERNRLNDTAACTNVYLKRIKYGNKVHFNRSSIDLANWDNFLNSIEYLLELVLDYGEHDATDPQPNDDKGWLCRQDPFSDYRAGFEIRTYRLCSRVLMFHHFAELGTKPCLVSAMHMEYNTSATFTFLQSVTQKGYIRKADGTYSEKTVPPIVFTYEALAWDTTVRTLSIDNIPADINDGYYQWVDLYNEGIAGVLTEQASAWYYKSNLGDGNFDAIKLVAPKPSLDGLLEGAVHFQDLEARGQQFLVSNGLQGYYELDDNKEWLPFRHFNEIPNINLQDPNLKLLDLNGDGRPDLLISEERVFTWYASKGKEGYERNHTAPKPFDEEKGPNIIFADSMQSIVLADMSGDGLMDIVRIRNSSVVYWPNLGYGKFGAKVSMGNAPVFDSNEDFNPQYVKLADLDGSGTTDIVYIGHHTFKVYFNQSGNSWSDVNIINGVEPLPLSPMAAHCPVTIVDLLGKGTGCIVWSSPLPQYAGNALRYIDLMAGKKPHVMTAYKNNMGKEVAIHYMPSTYFYLQDKKAGTPWITQLPFPVQCVSKVEVMDQVQRTRFTSQYTYHHGYYDHAEREFRGFGRVDQVDTEDFEQYKKQSNPTGNVQLVDASFHQPPVLTKTWYHTGAFLDKEKIFNQFAEEYYKNNSVAEHTLQDPALPPDLTLDEWREALRACKGMPLRTEVYTPDGSAQQDVPYTTSFHSCFIQFLQPRLQNQYAVFKVQESEVLTYTYERNPADPRITHSMTLEVDETGNVLKAAAISYGRKTTNADLTATEQTAQSKTLIVFSDNRVTNKIDTNIDYHLPLPCEALTWEITGLQPAAGNYFSINEIKNAFTTAVMIPFHALPTTGKTEKRLMVHTRSLLMKNDMSGPLPLGVMEFLALPYETYKLSLTPALRDLIFGDKVNDDLLLQQGKYVHLNDDNYWIAGGTQTFDPVHFYQATTLTDPFGYKAQIGYDTTYRFFVQQTTDMLGSKSEVAGFNYRTLSPYLLQDINGNRTGVRTDELGLVVSSFVMGKENENRGDQMDTATAEVSTNDQPSVSITYDLNNYQDNAKPNYAKTTARETHFHDNPQSITQTAYAYVNGSGQTLMQKIQAPPGIALQEKPDGTVVEVDTTPNLRWIGNGRTIINNKGLPVKQYEPYFSATFEFEDNKELVERGVSPILYYDSAGRLIRTEQPDGTFSKIEFDPWMQRSFDRNDTVLESQWYKDRITTPVPAIATPEEIAAANKTAAHANTPGTTHLDAQGVTFITIADNSTDGKYKTTSIKDLAGNVRSITDARGNVVMQYKYDMLGAQLYQLSMDAGERWTINDVMGKPLKNLDSRGHQFRYEYDTLHRPIKTFLQTGAAAEICTEKTLYGEGLPNDTALNLRGKPYQHFDGAGMVTNISFDFKGNLLQSARRLCNEYKTNINWNTNPALESATYTAASVFDALNRVIKVTAPDQSIITPAFNETGQLSKLEVQLQGAAAKTTFIKTVTYNAKGLRESIAYGNNTATAYNYDPRTLRITQIQTTGKNGTDLLQKLLYTYDPVGNITTIKDNAQQTIFFNNNVVSPTCDYTYDAVYRLSKASGREHIGQNLPASPFDESRTNLPQPGDGAALRNYIQSYAYDAAGNILQMIHAAGAGSWTRTYSYEAGNNRLHSQTTGSSTETFTYDEHGNITALAHLPSLTWDDKDELRQVSLGGGGTAYYVYDSSGQRIRKVIERQGGIKEQRLYLGVIELFQRTDNANKVQEATATLHLMDSGARLAMVETRTVIAGAAASQQLTRYQYSNHLGSAALELDENATVISYEEYHPYGTTAYQAMNAAIKAAVKRYRYTGMERDEETGLQYHGARYYLPWLARWLSADPIGVNGGMNLYRYCSNNPVVRMDVLGTDDSQFQWAASAEENKDRHERLIGLLQILNGHIYYRKSRIRDILARFGDDKVLLHYGFDTDDSYTQMGLQKAVIRAIREYDAAYLALTVGGASMGLPDDKAAAAKAKQEADWQANVRGYNYVTGSVLAGIGSGIARIFTDDPDKIAGAAGLGAAIEGAGLPLATGIATKVRDNARQEQQQKAEAKARDVVVPSSGSQRPASPANPTSANTTAGATGPAPTGDIKDMKSAVDIGGTRIFYGNPPGGDPPIAACFKGNNITFDSKTTAKGVELVLEHLERENPGAHVYAGSGTHGTKKGDWSATDPKHIEKQFYYEDVGAMGQSKLPGLGARYVFDVSKPAQSSSFLNAEKAADQAPPGTVFTMANWCWSTAKK